MNDQQLLRYSRHIMLDAIGIEGQQKILQARALVIGAGGLGSPAAMYLAASGIGQLTLVDNDEVDLTNLQRQIMHNSERIGHNKAASGQQTLRAINPGITLIALNERLAGERLQTLVAASDVVLDCSDNFATRHAVNAACVAAKVPLVSGAAIRFDGQLTVFDARSDDSPCYACLFPPDQQFEEVACATMGVFAPLVGIIGSMQAAEALKLVSGCGEPLVGKMLMLEALAMEWNHMRFAKNSGCRVCATKS
ncbi:MAG: molybdopterin-synthase adenylyltransferase MoeB [Pseudomonadota bacterium]|jgi:molybdopterin/thiamine biosynthesis adenylyltransferase